MATTISSTFQIITELAAGTGTTNIANPGRSFRVVGIYGTGLNNGTITVSKVADAGTGAATQMGVVTLATGDLNDAAAALDATANRAVLATDALRIVRAAANSTRCVLECEAYDAPALTES